MWFLILLLIFDLLRAEPFCVKGIDNDTEEPYLSYELLRIVERAVLESGHELRCDGDTKEVRLRVKEFKEVPIAYTSKQRVSSYNLSLSFELNIDGKGYTIRSSVPYTLPYGGLGDIPRRKAINDLLDKIYGDILNILRR